MESPQGEPGGVDLEALDPKTAAGRLPAGASVLWPWPGPLHWRVKSAAPRWLAALVAGLSSALIMYAVFLSDGRPFPYHHRVPDVELAYKMIPLELLTGLLVGGLVFWLFGRRQASAPRSRRAGAHALPLRAPPGRDASPCRNSKASSPLSAEQARQVVGRLTEAGRLVREGDSYRLR